MWKPWSWPGSRVVLPGPAAFAAFAGMAGWAAFAVPAARAATVLERAVTVEIQPDGGVVERNRFVVRLDVPSDFANWSPFAIGLDENRTLLSVEASATQPDGKVVKVGRKGLDTAEVSAEGELHSSRRLRTVEFPAVPVGSTLRIDFKVAVRPYFPAGEEALGPSSEAVERLRVEVKGAPAGWRWRLDGPREGLTVEESPGGVVVTAAGRGSFEAPDRAPGETGAVLRYAWGPQASWEAVGVWYQGLLGQVPRGSEAIRRKALELTAGKAGLREKAEALADFAQSDVRYVAVEVGIGGYRPALPADTLTRRWGDCKDKAILLVDLLEAVGIEAYPALILLDSKAKVDREFPSPYGFNHMIVAIPAAALGPAPAEGEDPVAGGYLFVDATQTSGSLAWLHPGVQDQEALVVRGARSQLVRTPLLPARETQTLRIDLAALPDGKGVGQVRLEMTGEIGAAWTRLASTQRPTEIEQSARRVLAAVLPGVDLMEPHWKGDPQGVPRFEISARIEIPGLFGGDGPARAFLPFVLTGFPPPSLLDERKVPVVLGPEVLRSVWRIKVPEDWCPPEPREVDTRNELGSFRQTLARNDGLLTVESRTEVAKRWIDPAQFATLKQLALAEHRTQKRRVRLVCPSAGGGGPSHRFDSTSFVPLHFRVCAFPSGRSAAW